MNNNSYCKDITFTDAIKAPFLVADGHHFKTVPLGIQSVYNFIIAVVLTLLFFLFLFTGNFQLTGAVFFILATSVLHSAYVQAYLIQGYKCKQALSTRDSPNYGVINKLY